MFPFQILSFRGLPGTWKALIRRNTKLGGLHSSPSFVCTRIQEFSQKWTVQNGQTRRKIYIGKPCCIIWHFRPNSDKKSVWTVNDVHIDLTFKTNNEEVKLLAVIAICIKTRVPIACLILDSETIGIYWSKTESVYYFLSFLVLSHTDLWHWFFLSDKVPFQIASI